MTQFLSLYADWAYLLLRVAFALVFIIHGWPKLKNLKENAKNFEAMGFKPGNLWGSVVAIVETFGGLAIFFGFYTQIAALLIAVNMLVAMLWKMKKGHGFVSGYEFDLILFVVALLFATVGAGLYSLDYNWLI